MFFIETSTNFHDSWVGTGTPGPGEAIFDIRFNGKNFNELEGAHKSLFNSYKVKEIKSYFDSKDKRDNTRYVFIAVCEKNL